MSWFCFSGLERYSSIWFWRQFSRSPTMACAVSAIMGVRGRDLLDSKSRILCVASKPPTGSVLVRRMFEGEVKDRGKEVTY